MATKIRDYTKLAADICDAVGKDNIISAAHWSPSTSGTKSRCSSWRTASVPSTG